MNREAVARTLGPEVGLMGRIVAALVGVMLSWGVSVWWGVAEFENTLDAEYATTLLKIDVVLVSPGVALILALKRRNVLGLAALSLPLALAVGFALADSDESSTAGIALLASPMVAGALVGGLLVAENLVEPQPAKLPPPPPPPPASGTT